MTPERCTDRSALLDLYERHRAVHPYGIADLIQLWDRSTWWRTGDAVVGLLDLSGSPAPVVYAIAPHQPERTLDLLEELVSRSDLPDRFVITGPQGLSERLAPGLQAHWQEAYVKHALAEPTALPAADPAVRVLDATDLPALEALHATDPSAGSFFHPTLLASGVYVGLVQGGQLVSSAGTHVLERTRGVAAIGNVVTHPAVRGRGYARRVVATLCHRLLAEATTIGLNVADENRPAVRLYQRLGFRQVHVYEEAELERPRPGGRLRHAADSGSLGPARPPV